MRVCLKCQNPVDEDALFCDKCGCRLDPMQKESVNALQESLKEEYQYCPDCGTKNKLIDKFCLACGRPMAMNSQQKTSIPKRRGKKKRIVLGTLLILSLVLVGGIFFIWKSLHFNGIKFEGKKYTFSAEKGIDDYEKINNGVVFRSGLDGYFYRPIGSNLDDEEDGERGENIEGKYSTFVNSHMRGFNDEILCLSLCFRENYETGEGISTESEGEEIDKAGYMYCNGVYNQWATEDGNMDWELIEKDYEMVKESNDLTDLEYYETLLLLFPDYALFLGNYVNNFDMVEECIGDNSKLKLMNWMACAKLSDDLMKGNIEYFLGKTIREEDKLLTINLYAREGTTSGWIEKWIEGGN